MKSSVLNGDHDFEAVLTRVLDLLVPFSLDRGFSVQDIELMVRAAATKGVARRQAESRRRLNISGIAAATGLSRSDVALLCARRKAKRRKQKPIDRILTAWQTDRRYLRENNRPVDLLIYGRSPSFRSLVTAYGGGIPIRAILDELLSRGDVTLLPNQSLRISNRKLASSNVSSIVTSIGGLLQSVESIGPRTSHPLKRRNLKRR